MTADLYDGLPTLATLAFHGLVAEPTPSITEADLLDPNRDSDLADLDDLASDEDETYDPDYDPDYDPEPDERLMWGGMDVPS